MFGSFNITHEEWTDNSSSK